MKTARFLNVRKILMLMVPLMAFQNCGRRLQSPSSNTTSPVQTESTSLVMGDMRGVQSQSLTAQPSKYVIPLSIDFYSHLSACDSTVKNNCVTYFMPGSWQQEFLFNVDVESGKVADQGGNPVLQISADELKQLRSLLNGSVVASQNTFASQGMMCMIEDLNGLYARIQTDSSPIDLQFGGCQADDLYGLSTHQPVGLHEFLNNLSAEVAAKAGIQINP